MKVMWPDHDGFCMAQVVYQQGAQRGIIWEGYIMLALSVVLNFPPSMVRGLVKAQ